MRPRTLFYCLLTTVYCLLPHARAAEPEFTPVIAPRSWSFPRDHGRHDGFKTEWWYFTGNLRERSTGRQFGYQLTFFRSSLVPRAASRPSAWGAGDLYLGHAAISDVEGRRFVYAERLSRGRTGLAYASDNTLDVVLKDWWTKLDEDGRFRLFAKDDKLAMDLTVGAGRGPVLQGPGGLNAKGPNRGQASYYYSMTRLLTTGTLTVEGNTFEVEGVSWLDREFSSSPLAENQAGWDWLALSLDDGTDLMLYRLRDKQGRADYLSGTLIGGDGKVAYLSGKDITLTPGAVWKSPESGASYPREWTVGVPGRGTLVVRTRLADQELQTPNSTDVTYYEGTVDLTDESGKPVGEGYLEMTGYAKALTK